MNVLGGAFPLPPEFQPVDFKNYQWEYDRLELMRAHPWAEGFFALIAAMALAVTLIHLARLRSIWRATATSRPLPRSTAAPPLPA